MTELFSAQNHAPAVCSMISGWTVSACERAAPASTAASGALVALKKSEAKGAQVKGSIGLT
jgi:hypothetical protein